MFGGSALISFDPAQRIDRAYDRLRTAEKAVRDANAELHAAQYELACARISKIGH